eukprot:symbB.v1.2.029366.t1/scaffold3207.1/size61170/2
MENFHPSICQAWEIVDDTGHVEFDGFYRTRTYRCGCGDLDNDARSLFSRIALPLLLIWGTFALRITIDGDREDYADGNEVGGRRPKERMWYLDYARILCVACVVSEHSGGAGFSDRNVLWVQQWVVPFLYVVSGIAFMLSKTGILKYEFRLFLVLLIGTAANGVAEMVIGINPFARPGWTMYQMGYVLAIMIFSVCSAPIKEVLKWRAHNPFAATPPRLRFVAAFYGFLAAVSLVVFIGGSSLVDDTQAIRAFGASAATTLHEVPMFLSRTFGLFFLVSLTACWGYCSSAGWILIVLSYTTHTMIPYKKGGHAMSPDLFLIGMVTYQWPLKYKVRVASILQNYWPFLLAAVLLCSMPSVSGRCDLHPLNTVWERCRFRLVEAVLVAGLVTGAFHADDPHGVIPWMNLWSLYAYCFHVAWARMLPKPYGALLTYGSIPLFYASHIMRRRRRDQGDQRDEPPSREQSVHFVEQAGIELSNC